MKALLGILAFFFFLIVLFLMLAGGLILRTIRRMRVAAEKAAEARERQYRDETGRRPQQYSQRQQTRQSEQTSQSDEASESDWSRQTTQPKETVTESGETIIDHRHQHRNDRKIFDDTDGEYVDFVEER